MKCAEFRADLSALLDNALEGERARAVCRHLQECDACTLVWKEISGVRQVVRSMPRVPPPPELELALRVRLSRDGKSDFLSRLRVRMENLMEPVAVPAMAGLLSAVLLFGLLIHSLAIPTPAQTEIDFQFSTRPRLTVLPPLGFDGEGQGISVELHVDAEGRIVDFRTLNGPHDPAVLAQLRSILLFTRFDPATTLGVRHHGTTVLNLQSIQVKG